MTNHNVSKLNIRRIAMWTAVLLVVLYIVYNVFFFLTCPEGCVEGGIYRCSPPPCP